MISIILFIAAIVFTVLFAVEVMDSGWFWSMLCFGLAIVWPVLRTKIVIRLYKKKYGYTDDKDAMEHFIRDLNAKSAKSK